MKYIYLVFFLLAGVTARGQSPARLSGRVTDSAGNALIGATVALDHTANSTHTNDKGYFLMEVPPGAYHLRVSFVGYQSFEKGISLPLRDPLLITLRGSEFQAAGVTVSTGYQELPRERATGSFVQVDRALLERSVSTNITDRLRDIVPGLSFNPVGTQVSIRGQSTLFSNADPLVVVDGFPYNQSIEDLNPNDVEGITILKDAAAASIWGSRAGNGVIVITTRKGAYNHPMRITLNSNITVGARPNLFYQPRMSSADYIGIEKKLFGEDYFLGAEGSDTHSPLSPVVELLIAKRDGTLPAAEADRQIAELSGLDVRNEISRYLYRQSVSQQYALGLDGGSAGQRYAYSAGYDKNLDNAAGNGFNRLTLSGKNTWQILDKRLELNLGINLTETGKDRNNPGSLTWNNGYPIYPYAALASANGTPLPVTRDLRQSFVGSAPGLGLLGWQYLPLEELRLANNHSSATDIRVNAGITYKLLPGLSAAVLYQYDHTLNTSRNLNDADSYYTRNLVNRFTQDDGSGTLTRPVPTGAILDLGSGYSINHDLRGQLNYNASLSSKHEITAIAGYEVQSLHVVGDAYRIYGYDKDHATGRQVDGATQFSYYDNPYSSSAIPQNISESDATDHYLSYYANAAYTYDRRLTLSASARRDESNLFGVKTNQKGVPLWSAGAAWDLGREAFYHLAWLPALRLRASYGYNGNINKSLSAYTTASYYDGSDSPTQLPYAQIINPPNPNLEWERFRHINLGIDFGAPGNRVSGSLEFYFKKGLDLIGNTSYPPSSGITLFTGNTATTAGHGMDLDITTRNLEGGVKWTTSLIVSHIVDKVTAYGQASDATAYLSDGASGFYPLAGRPLYAVYSLRSAGLDPQTGDPRGYLGGQVSRDYAGIIAAATPQTLIYQGPSRPAWFGSLRNTVSLGQFSLSAIISYELGFFFRRNSIVYSDDYGLSQQSGDYAKRWQQPGDERHTIVPSLPASPDFERDAFYTWSSDLLDKGDNIRLRDLRLSYDFSKGRIAFLPGAALQVYIYANNLGILWRANKDHLDPDVPYGYPVPRTVAGGIRLTY